MKKISYLAIVLCAFFSVFSANVSAQTLINELDINPPGDYDGDGQQDVAVWRPSGDASPSAFYARRSGNGTLQSLGFGAGTDYPAANWFAH